MKFRSIRLAKRFPARKAVAGVIVALGLLLASRADGDYRSWARGEGSEPFEADLVAFDFDSKEIVCRDRNGAEHRISSAILDSSGKIQVLLSREFIQSFPADGDSRERTRFILLAVALPAVFLLVSFFLCAGFLLGTFNPVRAIVGWCGSVVLGAFLVSFYVVLSARSPEAALGITVFGVVVVTSLLSLYVSIIYRTTVLKSFKVLALHFFGALFLILGAVLTVKFAFDPTAVDLFLDEKIFKVVGLT